MPPRPGERRSDRNRTDAVHVLDDRTGCREIVQVCPGERIGEDAAAVDPGRQHRHPRFSHAGRADLPPSVEDDSAGDQDAVELCPFDEPVSTSAWFIACRCADHALVAELFERRVGLGERQLGVRVRIVDQRDINAVAA